MQKYERDSKEVILYDFKGKEQFSDILISDNNLSGIDWSGKLFSNFVIERSTMDGSIFSNSQSYAFEFIQTHLKEVFFTDSKHEKLSFTNCRMIKSNFSKTRNLSLQIEKSVAHNINFSAARVVDSIFRNCEMYKANFSNALIIKSRFVIDSHDCVYSMQKSNFRNAVFMDCNFEYIDFNNADFGEATFINCTFDQSLIDNEQVLKANFIKCNYYGERV